MEVVWIPSLQFLSAFDWFSDLNLPERKDLELFCDVLAETGVETSLHTPSENLDISAKQQVGGGTENRAPGNLPYLGTWR